MAKFLDLTGLQTFYTKIKNKFVAKDSLDSVPTANSTNPVTSGGIKTALDNYRTIMQDASRGANLVTNGNGLLGTNYNWSGMVYDGSESVNGSAGSFYRAYNGYPYATDELIKVDTTRKYILSADCRCDNSSIRNAARLTCICLDIDKQSIVAYHTMYGTGTTTQLAKDLNNGDTKIYLESVSNWNKNISQPYQRGFIFWNYKNSHGSEYPKETYSRHYTWDYSCSRWDDYQNSERCWFDDASAINAAENSITLKSAWKLGTIPKGTWVSKCTSGSNYKYISACEPLPDTWTTLKGSIKDADTSGLNYSNKFFPGTAFVKVGWDNSNTWSNTNKFHFTNISFYEVPEQSEKLATARKLKTNLASADDVTFDGSSDQTNIPVTGTLPVANGGTGKTTAVDAANTLITALPLWTEDPTDNTTFIRQDRGGTSTYGRVKASTIWNYIKGKSDTTYASKTHEHTSADIYGLGSLATKSTVAKSDLDSSVQESLGKADTAIQDISGKQDKLTFDSTPTAGSSNPVTSAGIKAAIDSGTNFIGNKSYDKFISALGTYQQVSKNTHDFTNLMLLFDVTDFEDGTIVKSGADHTLFNGDVESICAGGYPEDKKATVVAHYGYIKGSVVLQSNNSTCKPCVVRCDFTAWSPTWVSGTWSKVAVGETTVLNTTAASRYYAAFNVSAGQEIYITTGIYAGSSAETAYLFVDDKNVVKGLASAPYFNEKVVVPSGATKLYIQNAYQRDAQVGLKNETPTYYMALRFAGWAAGTIYFRGKFSTNRTTESNGKRGRPFIMQICPGGYGFANSAIPAGYTIIRNASSLTNESTTANALYTARSLAVNLGSTTAVTFNGSSDQNNIPVSGTLSVANGGTGATSALAAQYNLLNSMPIGHASESISDSTMLVGAFINPSASYGAVYKSSVTKLWDYTKGKADTTYSPLGHTHTTNDVSGLGALASKSTVNKSDLDNDVQISLGKADTAVQDVSGKANVEALNTLENCIIGKNGFISYSAANSDIELEKYALGTHGLYNKGVKIQMYSYTGDDEANATLVFDSSTITGELKNKFNMAQEMGTIYLTNSNERIKVVYTGSTNAYIRALGVFMTPKYAATGDSCSAYAKINDTVYETYHVATYGSLVTSVFPESCYTKVSLYFIPNSSTTRMRFYGFRCLNTYTGADQILIGKSWSAESADTAITLSTTLSMDKGGTGATTQKGAEYNILKNMTQATTKPFDNYQMVFSRVGEDANATNGVLLYRKASLVWSYFKDKTDALYATISHSHSSSDITGLGMLATKSSVADSDISGTISDTHIASASTWNSMYSKPSTGIPASDLASGVIPTSLPASDVQAYAKTGSGITVSKSVPVDAVFTDTTYESKSAASSGTDVSLVTTGEKYAWNSKQDALTFDSAPTSSSTNPVTSGGVYNALANRTYRVAKAVSQNKYLCINFIGTDKVYLIITVRTTLGGKDLMLAFNKYGESIGSRCRMTYMAGDKTLVGAIKLYGKTQTGSYLYLENKGQTSTFVITSIGESNSFTVSEAETPVMPDGYTEGAVGWDYTIAKSLHASRSLQVSLSTSEAQAFDGSSDATSIGVSGQLADDNIASASTWNSKQDTLLAYTADDMTTYWNNLN